MKEEKKTEGVCLSGSLTDGSMIGMVVVSRDGRPFVERAAYHHPKTRGEMSETISSLTAELDAPSRGRFMITSAGGEVMLVRAAELNSDPAAAIEKLVRKRWADWEDRVFGLFAANLSRGPGAGQDLVLYTLPKSEFEAMTAPLAGLKLGDLRLAPASLVAARILGNEKSMADERVAILDLAGERTQIVIAHGGAIVAERGVEVGLDALFTAIQHKLELKFIGSAAKLFYDGIYDFGEVEDELIASMGEKILPGLKELETAIGKPVSRILPLNLAAETIWVERPLAKFFNRPLPVFPPESLAKTSPDLGRLGEVVSLQALLAALSRGEDSWNGISLPSGNTPGLKPALQVLAASESSAAAVRESEKAAKAKPAPTPPPCARPGQAHPNEGAGSARSRRQARSRAGEAKRAGSGSGGGQARPRQD